MKLQDDLGWNEHFNGKNGLISSLNKRLFAIRRLSNHVPPMHLLKLAHALWMSKLRYGLQLCSNVRLHESDPSSINLKAVQIAQNKLLRLLDNSTLKDRKHSKDLLAKFNLLSVNQTAIQIKLMEAWKATHLQDYPTQMEKNEENLIPTSRELRPTSIRHWKEDGKTCAARESFSRNSAKIWNQAPKVVTESGTLSLAKKNVKEYCKMLPV